MSAWVHELGRAYTYASAHVVLIAAAGAALLLAALFAQQVMRNMPGKPGLRADDVLTFTVAGVATAVAVSGMWRFFAVVLHLGGFERATFCAVLELAMFTEGMRAKRNMEEFKSAGVDGTAMWALAALSGLLAAWSAGSFPGAVFRFSMPIVAAWLWHRGLALARQRATGRASRWQRAAERIMVRFGLADPDEREVSEVAAYRRLTILARSAKRLRMLRESRASAWRIRRATRRLDNAMLRAVEFAGFADSRERQAGLLAQMGALYGAASLADLDVPVPWADPVVVPSVPESVPSGNPVPPPMEPVPGAMAPEPTDGTGAAVPSHDGTGAMEPASREPVPSRAPRHRPMASAAMAPVRLSRVDELLPRARALDAAWQLTHDGRRISANKIVAELGCHKRTALALLKTILAEESCD